MKFNFKKIASILTGAVMLSSTVALAAAANFPAPFVENGAGDYAVVYGSAAVSGTDNVAAANINDWLAQKVTTVTPAPAPSTNLTLTGEVVPLFKSNDKINLGDALNSVYSSSIKSDKLTTVLADETFTDEDGTDYEYTQKVTLGSANLTHFADEEVDPDEKPVLGFEITTGTNILKYEVDFTDPLKNSSTKLQTNNIKLLGKEWYISKVEDNGDKLTLLDTTNELTMVEGTTQTITVGDKSYEVTLDTVENDEAGTATFKVNGKSYSITEGNSKKVATDTFLAITNTMYSEKKDSKVEFTLGSGELVLEDDTAILLNDESVDDVETNITRSSTGLITDIDLIWTPSEDDVFLVPGKEIVMPGLGALKLSYTGFTFGSEESTKVRFNGEDVIELRDVEVKDGKVSSIPLLYGNGVNFTLVGKDSTHILSTSTGDVLSLDEDLSPIFVATWENNDDWESYVFELTGVSRSSDENLVTIKNLASGASTDFKTTASSLTAEKDFGELTLTVSAVNTTYGNLTMTVSGNSGEVYTDVLITKGGLWIDLPVSAETNSTTLSRSNYVLNFVEANKDGDVATGSTFSITADIDADGKTYVSGVSANGTTTGIAINSDSDDEEFYVEGELATKILYTASDDRPVADITYHTSESYANVYIAEAGASTGTNGGGSGGNSGWLPVKDTEVSSVQSKNLIVVGGSCVNTVAAKLLGSETPLCEAAWMSATGGNVGAGSFLIQTFANPWSTGQVATLVAGYDAKDTENAVNALKVETIDTTAGKKYVKLAGSTLQLV